jgi:ArpU family phage transcriptional regulator
VVSYGSRGKEWRGIVNKRKLERELYAYPALLAAIENAESMGDMLPSLVASYSDMPGGGGISNPTEKYAVMRAEKAIRVKQIDRGLLGCTFIERDIIKLKYFDPGVPRDKDVYMQLALGNTNYYKLKEQALRKMAIALNMI